MLKNKDTHSINKIENENKFVKDLLDFYKYNYNKLQKEINQKNAIINNLNNQINIQNNELNNIKYNYNHKIYKLSTKILNFIYKLIPPGSIRRKILKYIVRSIKKIIKIITRSIYKLIPSKNIKRKIMNKLHNSKKLSKILQIPYYPHLTKGIIVNDKQDFVLDNLTYLNKSVAIHLHLFYTDLAKEFFSYLINIPYVFDLYISVPYGTNKSKIKRIFKKNINIKKLVIRESENSGRDYGPMFVLFKKELRNYDYVMHIHSKKSLRTGSEQFEWRQYLLNNLLGSKELVMKYFALMEYWNVGIAYPMAFHKIGYLCYTHLGSKGLADVYYKKLGLELKDEYLHFSAGSMFWCKGELLKELFDLDLEWEDFGADKGQDDGTLEYVLERIWSPLVKKYSMNFVTYDNKYNKFYLNYDHRNLDEYKMKTKESVFNRLMYHPIITFDIFDTLVTRKVYEPDDNFIILDELIKEKYDFQTGEFLRLRKQSETEVRKEKNYQGDCTIDEIYDEIFNEISKTRNIAYKEVLEMKNMEIDNDIKSIIPRKDMLELYNNLLENNKQIILISDMYYTKDIIEKILNKCGYYNYYDLLVSSEVGYRKDNGTMWEYFYKKYENTVHVGDNEESDFHKVINLKQCAEHVMQGKKMFELSYYNYPTNELMENRIMQGLIINKGLFNSPFALNENNRKIVDTTYNYGYSILGPIFLYYFIWLINNIKGDSKLLFISREGHYLQKIYKHILSKSKKTKELENIYFLTSRKAISVANIHSLNDIKKIFMTNYTGNLKELFLYRLGIMLDEKYMNVNINLPQNIDYVMNIAKENLEIILNNAKYEKENYKKYIKSTIEFNEDREYVIVDLGYSGTVQCELSKFLNKKISGAYFIVNDNLKPLSIGAKVYSCYNSVKYDRSFFSNPLGIYSLYLEALLTSPNGQLFNFDNNGQPVFLEEKNKSEYMKKLEPIYQGIIDFIDDMDEMNIIDISDYKLDKDFILNNFNSFAENNKNIRNEITKLLKVEDLYTSNGDLESENFTI